MAEIRMTGPDGHTFFFEEGTPDHIRQQTIQRHYGTNPEAGSARASAARALGTPPKRDAFQRFGDVFNHTVNTSFVVEGFRRGYRDGTNADEMIKAGKSGSFNLNPFESIGGIVGALASIGDHAVSDGETTSRSGNAWVQSERSRRQTFAATSDADPWYQAEGGIGGKAIHGLAALGGTLAGAALDPTSYVTGGSSIGARVAIQGTVAGAADLMAQASAVGGTQDSYDWKQTLLSAGAGAAFQGAMDGAGSVARRVIGGRAEPRLQSDEVTVSQAFREELDTADRINLPALSMDEWTFRPTQQGPVSAIPMKIEEPRMNGPRMDGPEADAAGARAGTEPKDDPWNGVDWGVVGSPERVKAALGHLDRLREFVKPDQIQQFVRFLSRETVEVADDAGHWNRDIFDFDKLANDPDKFEVLTNVMADIFKPLYDAAGDAKQTWQSVRDRQATLGITVSDAIKAHADITGDNGLASKIHAIETIAIQHTDHLVGLIDEIQPKLSAGNASADEIAAIAAQLNVASMFDAMAAGSKSEVGRALNILKMQKKRARLMNDIQEQMDALNSALGGGEGQRGMADAMDALKKAHKQGGARGMKDAIRQMRALGWEDYVSYYMVSGYLSTPATAVRNAIGSVLHASMTIGERYIAAAITSPLRRGLSGGRGSAEGVTWREANAYVFGIHQSFMDASRAGFKAFKSASTITDPENAVGQYAMAIPFEYNAARRTKWKNDGLLRSIPDMLGTGVYGTLRTLGIRPSLGMDEFTKVMTRRMQMNALAVREASYRSARLKGADAEKEFTRTLHAIKDRPTAEAFEQAKAAFAQAGESYDPAKSYAGDTLLQDAADMFASVDLHEAINDYARLMTFQNSGPTLRKFESFIGSVKLFKALYVPFLRTPVNLVRAGMFDRNPVLAGFIGENRKGFANYFAAMDGLDHSLSRGGAEADMVIARMVSGVGFMATAGLLFANGDLVGKRSAAEEQDGIKSYSIRLGGRWFQYSTLSPVAEMLGIVADMSQIFKDYDLDDDGLAGIAGGVMSAITNNIVNKAALQGIGDFWDLLDPAYASNDTNKGEQIGANIAKKLAGSLVPAIVRNTAYTQDPVMREAQGFLEHLKAVLPKLSETLPEKRDWLGLPIIRTDKDGGVLEGLVQPLRVSERSTDMVRLEVSVLADLDPELKIASRPQARFNGQKMTPREHNRVLEIQGQVWRHPVSGLNMHETLTELIESPAYADMGDPQRATEIKKVVSQFGKWTRAAIKRGEYPELAEMVNRTGGAEAIEMGEAKGWEDWQVQNKARGYGVTNDALDAMFDFTAQ